MKVIGYLVSVLGIGLMVVGFGILPLDLSFFGVYQKYISGVGMAMVGIGVILALNKNDGKKKGKISGGEDEIPIYEGVGKKRRVVGYRKG